MLKVALFMQDLSGGGVERMRLALARALVDAECDVSLIVVNAVGPLVRAIPPAVKLIDLNAGSAGRAIIPLRRYLKRHRPDFLVSSLDHNNIAALCARAMTRTTCRVVICQHNALSHEVRLGWRYSVVPWFYRVLSRWASAIIAVSHGVADDLAAITGLSRRRIFVIGNPVLTSAVAEPPACPPHPWLSDVHTPVFLFVGRLVAQKNPLLLMAAFALHVRRHPGRLIILGDGPLRQAMAEAAEKAGVIELVHFAGFATDPRAYISYAHALLLTSDYEGFGNVIVEALACGTPVIATDCPHGPAEILNHGRYGRLVPTGNAEALAKAMAEDLHGLFPGHVIRARASYFTAKRAAADHLELFSACLAKNNETIFGLRFNSSSAEQIAQRVLTVLPADTSLLITPNSDHVRLLHVNAAFRQACRSAEIVCADGWPVALFARLRGNAIQGRTTGCDILHALLNREETRALPIFAVVESQSTATALARWLEHRGWTRWTIKVAPPNLSTNIRSQLDLASTAMAAQPQILIITLGAPTSEIFTHVSMHGLPACWVLCVGQALRIEIGQTSRAPASLRRLGLEWAWRCLQEPLRLSPRYLRALLWFPYLALIDTFSAKRHSTRTFSATGPAPGQTPI